MNENIPTSTNNPGDLRDIGQTGATQNNTGFAQFQSPQAGYAALLNDIQTKINNHPNWNLVDFSKVYAPDTDGNDPGSYAAKLANQLGVAPNTTIGSLQSKIGDFANAIASNEGFNAGNSETASAGIPSLPSAATGTSQSDTPGLPNLPAAAMPQQQAVNTTQPTLQTGGSILNTVGNVAKEGYGLFKSAEQPFINTAAIPVQALAAALGKQDPYAQGIGGGQAPATVDPLNLEKKAGDIAQVGSYFIPGSGALGAAGMGALQGAGQAMSQGADTGTVLGEGLVGAGIGGALAGGSKLLGYGLQKLGNGLTGAETDSALSGLKNAYSSILNLSAGQRAYEQRSGQDLAQVLLDNQAPLSRNADSTLDASVAISKLENAIKPLNNKATRMLQHPQGVVRNIDLGEVLENVNSRIDSESMTAEDKIAAKAQAARALKAESMAHGTSVDPATSDSIKNGFWNKTFRSKLGGDADVLKKNVYYMIGNTLKKAEEDAVAGTDTEHSLKSINEQRSKLVDALTRLRKLDGVVKVKGGKLGGLFGGLTGAVIGTHSGGILGGITGDYLGAKASGFLNNPETLLAIERGKIGAARATGNLLGGLSKPVGAAASGLGKGLSVGARGLGLMGNLMLGQTGAPQ